jgi:hypothetical protein
MVDPSLWVLPRSLNSTEGLISSVRDQLAHADVGGLCRCDLSLQLCVGGGVNRLLR